MTQASRARVLARYGSTLLVEGPEPGQSSPARPMGRDLQFATNDQVEVEWTVPAVVTEVHPRTNILRRQEGRHTKILATNLDHALVVVSGFPPFCLETVGRLIASLIEAEIGFTLILNKADLPEAAEWARETLRRLQPLWGADPWPVVEVRAREEDGLASLTDHLVRHLDWESSPDGPSILLTGQSGMGKSTVLNRLVPDAQARTQEISEALQSGKHTTTTSRAYRLQLDADRQGWLIDSPGFQRYGIGHLDIEDLQRLFPDWVSAQSERSCRFRDCQHLPETPGCQVQAALDRWRQENVAQRPRADTREDFWAQLLQALPLR